MIPCFLLLPILNRVQFVDPWSEILWVSSKGDPHLAKELIHSVDQSHGLTRSTFLSWCACVHDDSRENNALLGYEGLGLLVSEVGCHNEIVFDNEGRLLVLYNESLYDPRGLDTLLGIKISGWLVDQVDCCWFTQTEDKGDFLEFAA